HAVAHRAPALHVPDAILQNAVEERPPFLRGPVGIGARQLQHGILHRIQRIVLVPECRLGDFERTHLDRRQKLAERSTAGIAGGFRQVHVAVRGSRHAIRRRERSKLWHNRYNAAATGTVDRGRYAPKPLILLHMSSVPVVRVALPTPLRRLFDYRAGPTDGLALEAGTRVRVPFGQRSLVGVAMETAAGSELPEERLKPVLERLDAQPIFDPASLALLGWAADYYHHPIGEVLSAALPKALRLGAALEAREERWVLTP